MENTTLMRISFASSLGTNKNHIMHTKSDNIEIMNGTETSDSINELFNSFLRRWGLERNERKWLYIWGNWFTGISSS